HAIRPAQGNTHVAANKGRGVLRRTLTNSSAVHNRNYSSRDGSQRTYTEAHGTQNQARKPWKTRTKSHGTANASRRGTPCAGLLERSGSEGVVATAQAARAGGAANAAG